MVLDRVLYLTINTAFDIARLFIKTFVKWLSESNNIEYNEIGTGALFWTAHSTVLIKPIFLIVYLIIILKAY